MGCFLNLLEAGFFISVRNLDGGASGLLVMGGARIESTSVACGVFCLLIALMGSSGGVGGEERERESTAPGIPEVVLFLLAGLGLLSPLEDEVSSFGRRSDAPGVVTVAVIFDMGRGVDSSSGRNSFSSSPVKREESLVSIIWRILGWRFRGLSVPSMDVSPAGRSDVFMLGLTTLEASGAAATGEEVSSAGDEDSVAFGRIGASGDLRLDFIGLFNPDP